MTEKRTQKRDFLSLKDCSSAEFRTLLNRASELKRLRRAGIMHETLRGKSLGLIFEKASTRTRVSFESGMFQLGGQAIFLSAKDMQWGRGETIADSARVLSRYLDGLMIRTFEQEHVETMARFSDIPIINGLTDRFHPCQILADVLTFEEHRGDLTGRKVAWIGDGNNMANTWIQAAELLSFELVLACPEGYEPDLRSSLVTLTRDPRVAASDAHLLLTDVWASMGQEEERKRRLHDFAEYQVTSDLMALAQPEALFMHCLPAHRGEEVSEEVLEGDQSVVWDEAENRLHTQKAVLEWLMV